MNNIEWTHKKIEINDIRKVKNFYILSVNDKKITSPIFVDHIIFEGRIKSYFLKNSMHELDRDNILKLKWNMVINQGYFIKYSEATADIEKNYKDPDRFYISFLEIDGPLGTYISTK